MISKSDTGPPSPPQPFVGRGIELARLRAFALGAPHGAMCVIEGPPGRGKTALLEELWRGLPLVRVECTWIDAHGYRGAAAELLEGTDPPPGGARVIMVDGWDEVTSDIGALFPRPPAKGRRAVHVLAGRTAVAASLPQRPLERIALGPLGPHDSDTWLARFAFGPRERAQVAASSYGDPLAIALSIDIARISGVVVVPARGPLAVEALSAHLLGACRRTSHRLALLALAQYSPLDDEGLRLALGTRDVDQVMSWLEQLAIVRSTPSGLALQPAVGYHLLRAADPGDQLLASYVASRLQAVRATA